MTFDPDVIVVGGGNAALTAALSASESGARVLVLEAAPEAERGGNSRFTGGIFRIAHDGKDDLTPLITEEHKAWLPRLSIGPYTREAYREEWMRTSQGRPDARLVDLTIERSRETVQWMHSKGVAFELTFDKLFDPSTLGDDTVYEMVPGGALRAAHEGVGLIENLYRAVDADPNIEVWYESPVGSLITRGSTIEGVRIRRESEDVEVRGTVILAAGGFEANPEMRLRYLGPGWDTVRVRGSRFNMGTMLQEALRIGAQPIGHWEGCHASPLDAAAPKVGDLRFTDKYSRYSYPYALLVNSEAQRFVDEGEAQVWLTYAKTGAAIGRQPGGIAYQIFDRRTSHLLEPRYSTTAPVEAATLEELAEKLGLDPARLRETVDTYNSAVDADADAKFNRFELDGLAARPAGQPPKSNWAQPIDQGPFIAYPVVCGITFTYGGLAIDTSARVLDTTGRVMPGLYAVGEIAGDFFYYNYAGGAGLVRGAVFGRIAGAEAAARAKVDAPVAAPA